MSSGGSAAPGSEREAVRTSDGKLMATVLQHVPSLTIADAERVARERYGRRGPARALTSERDQNFFIEDAERGAIVLKIANAL